MHQLSYRLGAPLCKDKRCQHMSTPSEATLVSITKGFVWHMPMVPTQVDHRGISGLVVSQYESQLGWFFRIIPNIWKNKKCSKPPTRLDVIHIYDVDFCSCWLSAAPTFILGYSSSFIKKGPCLSEGVSYFWDGISTKSTNSCRFFGPEPQMRCPWFNSMIPP